MYSPLNISLSQLDTGITHLGGVDIPLDSIPMSEEFRARMMEDIPDSDGGIILSGNSGRIFLNKKNGVIKAKRLVSYHKGFDGHEIPFEINQESAGTLRIIDLLPKLHDLRNHSTSQVYVIDEIDRCLHTMMTRSLIENYLQSCSPLTRSQLLFTTHDLLLMDQDLLRRDEIWITERDNKGCSSLMSLGDYKDVRYDKDIRKSYLKGSFGGIPKILLSAHNK
jgi:AAA15 family ATPase/GTPase